MGVGDRTARLSPCGHPSHQEEDGWFGGADRLPLGRHNVCLITSRVARVSRVSRVSRMDCVLRRGEERLYVDEGGRGVMGRNGTLT